MRIILKKDEEMETLKIDILDPKAKDLLEDLVDLKLISIQTVKNSYQDFSRLLQRLRRRSDKAPSLKEIAKESWLIGDGRPIKGYELIINSAEKEIINIKEGNIKGNSKGSVQFLPDNIEIFFTAYF